MVTYLIKFYSFAFFISVAQKKILQKQKTQNISLSILHYQSLPAALTKERRRHQPPPTTFIWIPILLSDLQGS